ncbi:LysR substrate-binding domain-containing protein [Luteolibacter flavescens]|uniref:LysR substrate-binding domain-containing protein n=1 Tax=Luteolibacter flavescens TaxID=1859460 RepID=A0ABT3FRF4_9BACT|nr:LysR substrate-binding domain-containing protein [Luteolibacter flavescens]MCW1885784.1 LysR substrate-binding domain-containing protein [Luteolibacter flavescens]
MELRHLRYFVAVADALNFRRAAERLNVTRPALSKQIKDLEEETGIRLLERDTVSVALTDAGSVFLAEARAILADVERAVDLAREAQDGRRGELRIGSVGQMASGFLPGALKAFGAQFPAVDVSFVEMTPIEQLAALGTGEIHLGFAYGRDAEQVAGISSLPLVRSNFGVSVSQLHPFADRKRIPLEELSKQTLLSVGAEAASNHRRDMLRIFQEEGVTPGVLRQISGFDALLNMIAADQGVSMLPEVLDLRNSHAIVTIPLDVKRCILDFTMWAVWRSESPSLLVRNFVRLLEQNRPVIAKQRAS